MQLAFVAGDLDHALRIVADAGSELGPVTILDELVAPALHHVGELWESDMISPADEHLATATAHRLIAEVAPRLRTAEAGSDPRVAVLATTPGDRHHTPLLMAEAVLAGHGWTVRNLGAEVPTAALVDFVVRSRPSLVALSATMANPELDRATGALRRAAPDLPILTGGAAAPAATRVAGMRGLLTALGL